MKRLDFRTFKVLFHTFSRNQEKKKKQRAAFPSLAAWRLPPVFFLNCCDHPIAAKCQQCIFQSIKDSAELESFVSFLFLSLLRGNLFLCSCESVSYWAMKLPSYSFSILLSKHSASPRYPLTHTKRTSTWFLWHSYGRQSLTFVCIFPCKPF